MEPPERSRIYNGASDAFSRAVEMVATPLIFGFVGYRLDAYLGTTPLFAVVFSVFCLGYVTWKICVRYDADMVRHEAELRANRRRRQAPPGSDSSPSSPLVSP